MSPVPQENSKIQKNDMNMLGMLNSQKPSKSKGMMNIWDIVKKDIERNHPGVDPYKAMATLKLVQKKNPNMTLVQEGNSIFATFKMGQGVAEFHTINADTPENLVKNLINYAKAMKQAGFSELRTTFDNPKVAELAKQVPNATVSIGQKVSKGVAKPAYNMIVRT